jgi:hypothetical protein
MDSQEVYKAFLHELKQENTTSATPTEFNYHIWRSQLEWITTRYWAFDQNQKSIDDLDVITVETNGIGAAPIAAIPNSGNDVSGQEYFVIPEDLLILLNVAFSSKIYGDSCIPDKTEKSFTAAKFLSADREKVVSESYYSAPSHEYPTVYYKIRDGSILPKMGSSIAQECVITYLKYPAKIEVDANGVSVRDSPFGDSQTLEIVRMAVLSYIETIESNRTQSMAFIENRKFIQNPLPNTFIQQR